MKKAPAARRTHADRRARVAALGGAVSVLLLASLLVWLVISTPNASLSEAPIGGPFRLIDDRGNMVTEHSFPGKYLLVYFGYTNCPDICPATLNTLAASLGRLGRKADLVQPLFITIDPAHDTPEKLHHYVAGFSPRLIGLSGAQPEISRIADAYGVVRLIHQDSANRTETTFDHSSVLYLMSPDGRFVAPIPADASEMVMARAIGRYVL